MPAIDRAFRKQKAVYWEASGVDDYGKPKILTRVELKVRWEAKHREVVDSSGNKIATEATVVVDREIPVGSILWKGKLDDLPDSPTNLKQVVAYDETPDYRAGHFRRVVHLIKYGDSLPVSA